MRLSEAFENYLNARNKKILNLRKKGIPLKNIAYKFKLSERHTRRIIRIGT
ncbi:MAG: hypothetical protein AABY84_13335 [Candidatus Firestonebacteria bacterium]